MAKPKQTAFKAILSLLPSLTDAEKEKLKVQLCQQTVCDRLGHIFKPGDTIYEWFKQPKSTIYCSRCGEKRTL